MKKIIPCLIMLSLVLMPGCIRKKKAPPPPPPKPVQQEAPKRVFSPRADSLLTMEQVKKWSACNPLLDSLSVMYQDSFKVADPQARISSQTSFTQVQDRICTREGLAGYNEYAWISGVMGNPRNKALLDTLGMTLR
jgi:hypothetical protein